MDKKFFCVFFLLLILLSACVKEPSIEDRLLCLDLSSYSKAAIPQCDSQEKCFSEAQKVFGEQKGVFPPLIENNLFELKNRVAKSWLYFNRAIKNLEAIHQSCLSYKDFSELDQKANELNHNIVQAFEESDRAFELSFALLELQKAHLENEEIGLIKEEKLFDDFIAVTGNLNEIKTGKGFGESSFASVFFMNAQRFKEISEKTGFEKTIIKETNILDIVSGFDEKILSKAPKEPFFVPLIANNVSGFIDRLREIVTLHDSVEAMKSFPSFEILEGYNRFLGTESSAMKKFFELNNSLKSNIEKINAENTERKTKIESAFMEAEQSISLIDDSAYSRLDGNFFSDLAFLLSDGTVIESQRFQINEFDKIKAQGSEKLFSLRQEYSSVLSKEFLFGISLGQKTAALKDVLSGVGALKENIDFLTQDSVEALGESCKKRVSVIGERVSSQNFAAFGVQVQAMAQAIKNKAGEFSEIKEPIQLLLECTKIVEEFNSLDSAVQDFDEFVLLEKNKFEACFLELKPVFELNSNYFLDLVPLYSKLSVIQKNGNEKQLLESCENLREKVIFSFGEINLVQEINAQQKNIRSYFEKLDSINNAFPKMIPDSTFLSLKKKVSEQESFFENNSLAPSKSISNLEKIKENSDSLLLELRATLLKYFAQYLEESTEIVSSAEEIVKANSFAQNKIKIAVKNDLWEFGEKIVLKIPLKGLIDVKTESKSANVSNVTPEKEFLETELSSVPTGVTTVFLVSSEVLARTSETQKPLVLTEKSVLMENEVSIESKTRISLLEVSPALLEFEKISPKSINVLFRQQSTPFSLEEKKLVFRLENVLEKDRASVFYEIEKPLSIGFELIESNHLDQNVFEYVFLAKIKNNTGILFEKAKVSFPLPIEEKNFSGTKVFDEEGKSVSFEKTFSNNISVTAPQIFPNNSIGFLVKLETQNYSIYWERFVLVLEEKILGLSLNENKKVSVQGEFFSAELEKIKAGADFKNSKKISELLDLAIKIDAAIAEATSLEDETVKYTELKKQLEIEIRGLKEKISVLEGLGYNGDAGDIERQLEKIELLKKQSDQKAASDPQSAILDILAAKNILSGVSPQKIIEDIQKEKNFLMQKAQALFELKLNDSLKEEITGFGNEISALIGQSDFVLAREKTGLLKEKVLELEGVAREKTLSLFEEKKQALAVFKDLAAEIPQKIELLRNLFASKEQHAGLEYFFPTTLARLDKLSLSLSPLLGSDLIEKIGSVDFNSSADFVSQLALFNELGSDFDKKLESMKLIDEELTGDLKKVGDDAKTVLEFAKAKTKDLLLGEEAKQALLMAQEKIDSNEFIEAMEFAKKAIELTAAPGPLDFGIPAAVYPLVLIVLAALFFKYKKSKAPMPQKIKIERAHS